MIGSFYDLIKREKNKRKVPNSVIKELNKDLPKGYRYIEDEKKGHLVITGSRDGANEQMVVNINLEKEGIPSYVPPEKVMDYIYRTQKTIHLHDTRIVKEGKTIYLREMSKDPVTGEDAIEDGYEMLIPSEFPPAAPMHMETEDGTELDIMFRRQPYDSMEASKFANESFPALNIEWIMPDKRTKIDEKGKRRENPSTITISVRATKAESVEDAITALKIFKGYATGTLILQGQKIGKDLSEETGVDLVKLDENITYWKDIHKLEVILGVHFDPRGELSDEDRLFCLELVAMFVYDQDVVYKEPFNHFHIGKMMFENKGVKEENLVGMENMGFAFTNGPEKCSLYGAEFEVFEAVSLLDIKLDRVENDDDGNGMELYISSSKNSVWKLVRRYCLTKEEASNKHEEMFHKYRMES